MSIISWLLLGYFMGYVNSYLEHDGYKILTQNVKLTTAGSVLGGVLANIIFGIKLSGFDIPAFMFSFLFVLLVIISTQILKLYGIDLRKVISSRLSLQKTIFSNKISDLLTYK